jgi:hypothetical protein
MKADFLFIYGCIVVLVAANLYTFFKTKRDTKNAREARERSKLREQKEIDRMAETMIQNARDIARMQEDIRKNSFIDRRKPK